MFSPNKGKYGPEKNPYLNTFSHSAALYKKHDFIQNLRLADTIFDRQENINILIGANGYWQYVTR